MTMALRITLPIAMSVLLSIHCKAQAPSDEEKYRAELTQAAKKAADILLGNIEEVKPRTAPGGDKPSERCPPRTISNYYCVTWEIRTGLGEFGSDTFGGRNNNLEGTASRDAAVADVEKVKADFDKLKASVFAPWVDPLVTMWNEQQQLRVELKKDLTTQIDEAIKPELKKQIIDEATAAATKQIISKLCQQGKIVGPDCPQN